MAEDYLGWLAEIAGETEIARFTRFPVPIPDGWVEQWYGRYLAGRADGSRQAFIALLADHPVGLALAPQIEPEARELELGYLVDPAFRGQGVATELLHQLTRWAFTEAAALRVELRIDVANLGSRTVAQRCGYRLEGTLRSCYVKNGLRSDVQVWAKLPGD